jgi:Concanavalin A-like lectin/glucanases superfamily
LAVGSHSIVASYSGDSGNASSSGSVSQVVQATTSGLVGWWKFDESGGTTAADASGNGNNGTLVNGPVWTAGKVNSALAFNGSNSYVSVPYAASLNATSAITLSAWVKTTSTVRGDIVSRFSGSPFPGYALVASGNCAVGQVGMWVGDNTSGYVCSPGMINDGGWHLVTGTYDGTTVRVYIDGALSNSGIRTNGLNNASTGPTIGAYNMSGTVGGFFNGSIDGVRIYNRALSATEVNALLTGG